MNSNTHRSTVPRLAEAFVPRFALGALAFMLGVGTAAGDTAEDGAAKALIAERCIMCHDMSVITSRHASTEEWHEIINRMIMNGAQVTESEAEEIARYLAKLSSAPQTATGQACGVVAAPEVLTHQSVPRTVHAVLTDMSTPDS